MTNQEKNKIILKERLPSILKDLRAGSGLSQMALANRLGLDKGSVYAWESGRKAPDVFSFAALVEIFPDLIPMLFPQYRLKSD